MAEKRSRSAIGMMKRILGSRNENRIKHSCIFYGQQKLAQIEKTPEPMCPSKSLGNGKFEAYYEKKAQPDFQGTLRGGRSIVFEAKSTTGDSIRQGALSEEQWDRLEDHWEMGACAFVLVSLKGTYYRIPWPVWRDMQQIFKKKSLRAEDMEPFKVRERNGVILFLEKL